MRVYQRCISAAAVPRVSTRCMLFLVLVVTDVSRRGARACMARLQVPLDPVWSSHVVAKRIFFAYVSRARASGYAHRSPPTQGLGTPPLTRYVAQLNMGSHRSETAPAGALCWRSCRARPSLLFAAASCGRLCRPRRRRGCCVALQACTASSGRGNRATRAAPLPGSSCASHRAS